MQEFFIDDDSPIQGIGVVAPLLRTPAASPKNFYLVPKIQELLQQLEIFAEGESTLGLLIGVFGSGKTTLLKALHAKYPQAFYFVSGHSKLDICQLLHKDFLANGEEPQEDKAYTLESLLETISKTLKNFTLIVDDADKLAVETFEKIVLAVNNLRCENVRLIFSGDQFLQKRFSTLMEKQEGLLSAQIFNFKPLSFKEMKSYLKEYLNVIVQKPLHPLSTKSFKKIYELSEGYIGRINRVAARFVVEKKTKSGIFRPRKPFVDILISVAILVLLALVGFRVLSLIMQNREHQTAKNEHLVAHNIQTVTASSATVMNEIIPPSFIASIENLPEEILTPPDEQLLMLPVPKPSHVKVPPKNSILVSKLSYTLQLLAAHQKQTLTDFAHQHAISSQARIIDLNQQGKSWYVLTYGHYNTREAALKAMQKLPLKLMKQKPIIRTVELSS